MSTTDQLAPFEMPRRARDVDLLGPTETGAHGDRWLICVGGSRYVQATPRLYLVLSHSDGKTSVEEIAGRVSRDLGRHVTPDQVRWLLRDRLVPAGLVSTSASADESLTDLRQSGMQPRTPLLAIRHRLPILPYRLTAPLADVLHHLYWPPAIVATVAAAAAVTIWAYLGPGLLAGINSLVGHPELVLVLLLLDVPLRIFHELGHASAMRRAGVPYGDIGVALYVFVPVYYTDVTHSYRLSRAERVRVDLGGMYFDCISMIALFVAFRLTGHQVLVLAILLVGINMLREFTPYMRYDGYYLMADLVGVHEPLSLLGPFARDHLLRRHQPRTLSGLNRVQRAALAAYFVVVLAFLFRPLMLLALAGPGPIAQFARRGPALVDEVIRSWQAHNGTEALAAGSQLVFWVLVPLGLALLSGGLVRMVWRATAALLLHIRSVRAEPLVVDVAVSGDHDSNSVPMAAQPAHDVHLPWEAEPSTEDPRLAELLERVREAEEERDAFRDRVHRVEAAFKQHLDELRLLGGDFHRQAELAQLGWDAAPRGPGTSTARHPVDEPDSGD